MPKAYGIETRERVLKQVSDGVNVSEVAKAFGVGVKTVYRWIERAAEGQLAPYKQAPKGPWKNRSA
ncbi:MAG: hypothetical protein A2007_01185 [Verrucomicrobia bacterium GWC2_42_7]|nr:MAG: hypothetical protein A2007_01185 [Verrucomicrobia bacterium GWC2_42_7]